MSVNQSAANNFDSVSEDKQFSFQLNEQSMFEAANTQDKLSFLRPLQNNFEKLILASNPSQMSCLYMERPQHNNENNNSQNMSSKPKFQTGENLDQKQKQSMATSTDKTKAGFAQQQRFTFDDDNDSFVNMGEDDCLETDVVQVDNKRFSVDSSSLKPKRQIKDDFVMTQDHMQQLNQKYHIKPNHSRSGSRGREQPSYDGLKSATQSGPAQINGILHSYQQSVENKKVLFSPPEITQVSIDLDDARESTEQPPLLKHIGRAGTMPTNQSNGSSEYQLFEVQCNPALSFKYKLPKKYEQAKIQQNDEIDTEIQFKDIKFREPQFDFTSDAQSSITKNDVYDKISQFQQDFSIQQKLDQVMNRNIESKFQSSAISNATQAFQATKTINDQRVQDSMKISSETINTQFLASLTQGQNGQANANLKELNDQMGVSASVFSNFTTMTKAADIKPNLGMQSENSEKLNDILKKYKIQKIEEIPNGLEDPEEKSTHTMVPEQQMREIQDIDKILEVEQESISSNISSILSKYKNDQYDSEYMHIDKGKSMQLDHLIKSIDQQSISISNHTLQQKPSQQYNGNPFKDFKSVSKSGEAISQNQSEARQRCNPLATVQTKYQNLMNEEVGKSNELRTDDLQAQKTVHQNTFSQKLSSYNHRQNDNANDNQSFQIQEQRINELNSAISEDSLINLSVKDLQKTDQLVFTASKEEETIDFDLTQRDVLGQSMGRQSLGRQSLLGGAVLGQSLPASIHDAGIDGAAALAQSSNAESVNNNNTLFGQSMLPPSQHSQNDYQEYLAKQYKNLKYHEDEVLDPENGNANTRQEIPNDQMNENQRLENDQIDIDKLLSNMKQQTVEFQNFGKPKPEIHEDARGPEIKEESEIQEISAPQNQDEYRSNSERFLNTPLQNSDADHLVIQEHSNSFQMEQKEKMTPSFANGTLPSAAETMGQPATFSREQLPPPDEALPLYRSDHLPQAPPPVKKDFLRKPTQNPQEETCSSQRNPWSQNSQAHESQRTNPNPFESHRSAYRQNNPQQEFQHSQMNDEQADGFSYNNEQARDQRWRRPKDHEDNAQADYQAQYKQIAALEQPQYADNLQYSIDSQLPIGDHLRQQYGAGVGGYTGSLESDQQEEKNEQQLKEEIDQKIKNQQIIDDYESAQQHKDQLMQSTSEGLPDHNIHIQDQSTINQRDFDEESRREDSMMNQDCSTIGQMTQRDTERTMARAGEQGVAPLRLDLAGAGMSQRESSRQNSWRSHRSTGQTSHLDDILNGVKDICEEIYNMDPTEGFPASTLNQDKEQSDEKKPETKEPEPEVPQPIQNTAIEAADEQLQQNTEQLLKRIEQAFSQNSEESPAKKKSSRKTKNSNKKPPLVLKDKKTEIKKKVDFRSEEKGSSGKKEKKVQKRAKSSSSSESEKLITPERSPNKSAADSSPDGKSARGESNSSRSLSKSNPSHSRSSSSSKSRSNSRSGQSSSSSSKASSEKPDNKNFRLDMSQKQKNTINKQLDFRDIDAAQQSTSRTAQQSHYEQENGNQRENSRALKSSRMSMEPEPLSYNYSNSSRQKEFELGLISTRSRGDTSMNASSAIQDGANNTTTRSMSRRGSFYTQILEQQNKELLKTMDKGKDQHQENADSIVDSFAYFKNQIKSLNTDSRDDLNFTKHTQQINGAIGAQSTSGLSAEQEAEPAPAQARPQPKKRIDISRFVKQQGPSQQPGQLHQNPHQLTASSLPQSSCMSLNENHLHQQTQNAQSAQKRSNINISRFIGKNR